MKIPHHQNQHGMALLEVIVAMLIFALAIFPLVKLQVMSMDATKAGYYKTETAAAALSLMDYLNADKSAIFDGKWNDVAVLAGEKCATLTGPQQTVCNLLEVGSDGITPDGNAIICVYGKRPTRIDPTGSAKTKDLERDMYLISIRAVWYIGKRQKQKNADDPKTLNRALAKKDCGANYDDTWDIAQGGGKINPVLTYDNIDHIKINMAY